MLDQLKPVPGARHSKKRLGRGIGSGLGMYITMRIGFLISISSEPVTLFSISVTSPLMRAMISPLRSSEKKERGNEMILWYTEIRMSRTIPVRIGTITAAEAK